MSFPISKFSAISDDATPCVLYERAAEALRAADSVVFDFDSLLVSTRSFHQEFLRRCLDSIGVAVSDSYQHTYSAAAGKSYKTLVDTIWQHEVSPFSEQLKDEFWRVVLTRCQDTQFLSSIMTDVVPVDEVDYLLASAPKTGIILSGSPHWLVDYLMHRANMREALSHYPLFSVFDHPEGKLTAARNNPSILNHITSRAIVVDDSLSSARAALSGLGLRFALVRCFEKPHRRTRAHHYDGNVIIELDSWREGLKMPSAPREQLSDSSCVNTKVANTDSNQGQKARDSLADRCVELVAQLRCFSSELVLVGGVAVALLSRRYREPSADFDFNVPVCTLPTRPTTSIEQPDLKILSETISQGTSQSAKVVLLSRDGERVDLIFKRSIQLGYWTIESQVDAYVRKFVTRYSEKYPLLLAPPEFILFEKLLAARGSEQGKHDLFDVACILETVEPRIDIIRHLVHVQNILTNEAYLIAEADLRKKKSDVISKLIDSLEEVKSLCSGEHADSPLYQDLLADADKHLVSQRCQELASVLHGITTSAQSVSDSWGVRIREAAN